MPTPAPLPTLPPNTHLPPPSGQLPSLSPAAKGTLPPEPAPTPMASARPGPTPAAFAQTNVFTFGSAPQNNFAKPTDAVQIFYATLSPTVVSNGTQVRVAVVTTSNAAAVKLQIGTQSIGLSQTAPGQWQGTFPFPLGTAPAGQGTMTLSLTASRSDGPSGTISIPVSIATPQ
jgi:hypothetical protein